ncbi:restriction endonuclease subunit S [uncultured Tenacibaculum sp.]|uniref:restriction endonuclease subunit S n=1 Tax=uncultured Tenacibaculum sp. TaxID=174713 RepID=UPI002617E52E|nr:restriction endonuclease subunit S [uncultured Tenacibaculum sp.]
MGKQLIPELRFPEFDDLWSFDIVNNRAKKLKVGFVGTCEPFYTDKESGVLLIRTGNLKGVDIVLDDVKYVTSNFHKKNIKSQIYPDDLILARHGGKGEICLVPKDFPTANCLNIVILRVDNSVNSKFFQLIYGSASIQKQIIAVTAGSTQTVINTKEIGKLNFKFPTLPEQQKIASFLTDVDDKITKLTKKKDLLEQYKKGIMQKIFSQDLRFKDDDGNAFPDWDLKKLGEIFKISAGGDIDKINVSKEKSRDFKFPIFANSEKQKGLYGYSNIYKIDFECVTVTGRGSLGNAIARYDKFYPIVRLLVLKPKINLNVFFFENAINQLNILSESTGVPQLTAPQISTYKIGYPSLKEQTKIANFLSDIDLKIEELNTNIENSKSFKKGLLQKMFV